MTLRERLADWISGGALTRAQVRSRGFEVAHRIEADELAILSESIHKIRDATAHTKNGTGKMVNRMAREALTSI